MALDTTNIKAGGEGGLPKTLRPGNLTCKINSMIVEEFKPKPGYFHIILGLEGPDMGPDFEGFWVDKFNEALGRYKGQVGRVKAGEWAFSDGTTKSGIEISRDTEMLKFLKNICVAFDCNDWLIGQNGKHETVESLIEQFNKDKPSGDNTAEFCLAGKEYTNKGGYPDFDLFLPKYSKDGPAFGKKAVVFNPETHIKKKKEDVAVTEFESDINTELPAASKGDFSLD
jgi:hypothetical protein